jgi:general stress protein 26
MPDRPISEIRNNSEYEKLNTLIEGIKFAMITTFGPDGVLRSRPMTTQKPAHGRSFDGTLWFFTGIRTAVATDVERSPIVNLSYADPSDSRYVSISGTAEISRDHAQMADMWNDLYKAWFPMGLEDPDICLLKVSVTAAEYWEPPSGKMIQLLGILKAAATGERAPESNHQVLEFSADRARAKSNHP